MIGHDRREPTEAALGFGFIVRLDNLVRQNLNHLLERKMTDFAFRCFLVMVLVCAGPFKAESVFADTDDPTKKSISCKKFAVGSGTENIFFVPYTEYVSTVIEYTEEGLLKHRYSIERTMDEDYVLLRGHQLEKCVGNVVVNRRVLVEYSPGMHWQGSAPVLSSVDICADSPTIYFIATDHIGGNDRGSLFSEKFYKGDSVIPTSQADLGSRYHDYFNGSTGLGYGADNYRNIYPHQFFVRTNQVDHIPNGPAIYSSDTIVPDGVEDGIIRSIATIYKQCKNIPDVLNVNGIALVKSPSSAKSLFSKTFFKGKFIPKSSKFEIIPDDGYGEIGHLFDNYYQNSKHNEEAFYERLRNQKQSKREPNELGMAIAGGVIIGLFGLMLQDNYEKCAKDPIYCDPIGYE